MCHYGTLSLRSVYPLILLVTSSVLLVSPVDRLLFLLVILTTLSPATMECMVTNMYEAGISTTCPDTIVPILLYDVTVT